MNTAHLTKRDFWMLEMTHIHEVHRIEEAALQTKRWFDYRTMTPGEATYLFAGDYSHEYVAAYKRTKDLESALTIKPFSPENIFHSEDLTAMWCARQAADSIGCKYRFYLQHIFDIYSVRGWKNLPRPNQLYGEEMILSVRLAWDKRLRDILQLADNDFFLEKAYVCHPDQIAYYAYLIAQIKSREHKHIALSAVLVDKQIFPHELAVRAFGEDVCKRALSI